MDASTSSTAVNQRYPGYTEWSSNKQGAMALLVGLVVIAVITSIVLISMGKFSSNALYDWLATAGHKHLLAMGFTFGGLAALVTTTAIVKLHNRSHRSYKDPKVVARDVMDHRAPAIKHVTRLETAEKVLEFASYVAVALAAIYTVVGLGYGLSAGHSFLGASYITQAGNAAIYGTILGIALPLLGYGIYKMKEHWNDEFEDNNTLTVDSSRSPAQGKGTDPKTDVDGGSRQHYAQGDGAQEKHAGGSSPRANKDNVVRKDIDPADDTDPRSAAYRAKNARLAQANGSNPGNANGRTDEKFSKKD